MKEDQLKRAKGRCSLFSSFILQPSFFPFQPSAFILLLLLCCFGGYHWWDAQFRLANILPLSSFSSTLMVEPSPAVKEIVSQPFTYLDRGRQSFVFLSKDQRYVLKFFDTGRLIPSLFSKSASSLQRKHRQLMEGYRVAYTHIPQEAGLVYVQLQAGGNDAWPVEIIDRFGFHHTIDLSQVPFVIQLKATPTREVLTRLFEAGKVEEAKRRLGQLVDLYVEGYRLGIYDSDHNFMYNSGFLGERPLRLDVGRLEIDENIKNPAFYLQDLKKIAIERCDGWMQRHFPQFRDEIMSEMQNKLEMHHRDTDSSLAFICIKKGRSAS